MRICLWICRTLQLLSELEGVQFIFRRSISCILQSGATPRGRVSAADVKIGMVASSNRALQSFIVETIIKEPSRPQCGFEE